MRSILGGHPFVSASRNRRADSPRNIRLFHKNESPSSDDRPTQQAALSHPAGPTTAARMDKFTRQWPRPNRPARHDRQAERGPEAIEAILGDRIVPGDVVLIRFEGPRGAPGMQEMLYPTSYLKSKGLGKTCALITEGRFSDGSSGLCIGHISPEAAEAGAIALVEEGDTIEIDIPSASSASTYPTQN